MFHLRLTSTMPAGHLTTSAPGCPRFAAPDWSLVWVLFLSPQSAVPQQDASPDPRAPRNSAVSTEVTQKRIANPFFFNKRVKMKFLHLATNGNLSPVVTCGHLCGSLDRGRAPSMARPTAAVLRPASRLPWLPLLDMRWDDPRTAALMAPRKNRRFSEVPGGSQGKCPGGPGSVIGMIVLLAFLVRPKSGCPMCFDSRNAVATGLAAPVLPKKSLYMENVGPPDAIQRDLSWAKTINPHDIRKWQRMGPSWSDIVTGSTDPSQENDSLILECGGCSVCQHHNVILYSLPLIQICVVSSGTTHQAATSVATTHLALSAPTFDVLAMPGEVAKGCKRLSSELGNMTEDHQLVVHFSDSRFLCLSSWCWCRQNTQRPSKHRTFSAVSLFSGKTSITSHLQMCVFHLGSIFDKPPFIHHTGPYVFLSISFHMVNMHPSGVIMVRWSSHWKLHYASGISQPSFIAEGYSQPYLCLCYLLEGIFHHIPIMFP